jgi:hypothetical protein
MAVAARGRCIDFSSPRGYYIDYTHWAYARCEVDEEGVPVVRARGGVRAPSPALVSRVALGNLELYLANGSPERREKFESLARWLVAHQETIPGGFGGWPMPRVPRGYESALAEGWFSGSVHSECLSTLVRAAVLLRTEGAHVAARRAFGGLRTSVGDGGFLRAIGDGGDAAGMAFLAFIDEFPVAEPVLMAFESHVLGLWAAFDFSFIDTDGSARGLFEHCLDGLVFVLEQYDLGYWTRGDLRSGLGARRPTSAPGIEAQATMLEVLFAMSGRPEFGSAARRWRSYADRPVGRARALLGRAWSAIAGPPEPPAHA